MITCVTIVPGVLILADLLKVLYVDDESGLLDVGKLFLEEIGQFSVDTHLSAKSGLSALASQEYDAIISDYQMPGMDGIAFLKQVRGSGNTIPFILFTGRGREEIVIQALNEGADFYLQKGGDPESQFAELAHKIRLAVQQRRAETSIRDHERREADILNFLPDATFAIDTNGVVIAWNRAMEDFSGILAHEMLGKGNYEYSFFLYNERRPILIDLVLQDNPEVEKQYPYVLRSGKKLYSEIFLPHLKGGKGTLIWCIATLIYDTKGKVVGAIESIRDISERKRSEEEVQFKNLVLSTQQETSPDAILIVDAGGRILQYNRKFVELFSIPEDLLVSRDDGPVLQHVTSMNADPVAFLRRVQYLYNHHEEKSFEELLLKDGRIIERHSSPMLGQAGAYFGRVWYFRDITARKRAEEALVSEKNLINAIFNSIPGMLYLYDAEGRLVRWNRNHELMTGYSEEELSRMQLFDWYRGDAKSQAAVTEGVKRTMETGFGEAEALLQRKDGTTIPMYFTASSLTIQGKQYFTGIGIDITEREKAKEQQRFYTEHLLLAQEIGQTGSWQLKIATGMVWGSDEAFRIFGIPHPDSGFIPFEQVLSTITERGIVEKALHDLIETDTEFNIEYSIEPADHSGTKVVHSVARVLKDDENRPVWIVGVAQDITGRKQAEQALRASEEKYRTVLENIQDVFYRTDREGRLVMASPSWTRLFGYDTPDECYGSDIATTFYYDPKKRQEFLSAVTKNGRVDNYEVTLKRKDGTPVQVSTNSHLYYDESGRVAGVEGIFRDITDRKYTEDALRASEEKYRTVFETTGTATVLIEADGTISLANSEYERLTGFSKDEVENKKKWMEFVLPEDLDRMLAQHRMRRQDPKSALHHYEFRLFTKTGELRDIFLTVDMIPGTQKSVASLLDVTVRKKREEELLRTTDELRAANEQIAATEEELRANLESLTRQEQALRESQKKLADIIEFLPDATFAVDADGVVIAWNHALEIMTGVKKEAVLGRGDHEYALPFYKKRRPILVNLVLRYDESVAEHYPGLVREKDRFFAEVFIPHLKGGRGAHLWFTACALYDSQGRITGAIESIRDVTEHKEREAALNRKNEELGAAYEEIMSTEEELRQQVEEIASAQAALRASEERMRNLYRNSPVGIEIYDQDGNLIDINPACCELFGIPSVDAVRGFNLFSNPQLPDDKKQQLRSCHRARFEMSYDFELVKKLNVFPTTRSGTIWIDTQIAPVKKSDGGIEYLVQIVDITERKRAEDALREEHQRLQNIIRGTRVGTWEWNVQTGETTFNERWAEIVGYTLDELSPVSITTWEALVHPEDKLRSESLLARHFSGELPYYDCEVRMRHKDGRWIWVQDRGQVITRTPDGKPLMMSGTHSDITELKGTEEALRDTYRQLELLTSITRHDILNKVSTLLGYIKILEKRTSDPVLADYIAKLAETAKAIRTQIDFTRIYEDLGTREPQWLEPAAIISRLAVPGNISLHADILGYAILADPMLEKVFFNLLDNTVRHGGHVTEVRISARPGGDSLVIVWEDNGAGIPADEKEHIFERGYGKNTGLGLFLSREILAITGITIAEDGKPGSGARFTITVPAGAWRHNDTA